MIWTGDKASCSQVPISQCSGWVQGSKEFRTGTICEVSNNNCIASSKICKCPKAKDAGWDCSGIDTFAQKNLPACNSTAK